jgi:hypothetical protein
VLEALAMAKAAPLPSVDKSEKARRYREKCGDPDRGILPIQPRSLIGVIVCIRGYALGVAAKAARLNQSKLLARAKSKEIAARVKQTSDEFNAMQVTQRPTFLIENAIGDGAVFSGLVRVEPLAAAIDALLEDQAAYLSWKAHFGDPPPR